MNPAFPEKDIFVTVLDKTYIFLRLLRVSTQKPVEVQFVKIYSCYNYLLTSCNLLGFPAQANNKYLVLSLSITHRKIIENSNCFFL